MKLPSLLAFTRSISPSVGVFFGVESLDDVFKKSKRHPIEISSIGLSSTISNYTNDIDKRMENNGKNVQNTQMALVPDGCDYCVMEFSLNVANNFKNPTNCNDKEFRSEINKFVKDYLASGKMRELAKLYLTNILTAKFMFRNLFNNSKMKVYIKSEENQYIFDVYSHVHSLSQFKGDSEKNVEILLNELTDALGGVDIEIGDGFKVQKVLNWKITTVFETSPNAEVYPSQEFIENNDKGKIISTVRTLNNKEQAAYHAQKIGNAIRTIDIWYPDFNLEDKGYPLPVEPYGIDRSTESVARKTDSLYTHLEKIDKYNKDGVSDAVKHYLIACLIRGGVFSGEKKPKEDKAAKAEKPKKN